MDRVEDGGPALPEPADRRRAARLTVARHATDPADLAHLLDILDLGPQGDQLYEEKGAAPPRVGDP